MLFKLCDFIIESNLHLLELIPVEEDLKAIYTFNFSTEKTEQKNQDGWLKTMPVRSDDDWITIAKKENGFFFRFDEIADFEISADDKTIKGYSCEGVPDSTISHLFLNQIMPHLVSGIDKRLVLHASAVEINGEAVVFAGMTGKGKSTLALYLCQSGFPLISDDFLIVEEREGEMYALPSYPGVRLWENTLTNFYGTEESFPEVAHYTYKKRLRLEEKSLKFAFDSLPLRQIYILGDVDEDKMETSIQSVKISEAFFEMMENIFRLDPEDEKRHELEFNQLGGLVSSVSFYRLAYPHNFDSFEEVRKQLLANLDNRKESSKQHV